MKLLLVLLLLLAAVHFTVKCRRSSQLIGLLLDRVHAAR